MAVNGAIEFARACGSGIVALSVSQPFPINTAAEGTMVIDEGFQMALIMDQAEENLRRVAEAATKAGVKCTTSTTCAFYPAEKIIGAAKRTGRDLMFLGSHGRRGLSRLLAGSVTHNVLAYLPLPVAPCIGKVSDLHSAAFSTRIICVQRPTSTQR